MTHRSMAASLAVMLAPCLLLAARSAATADCICPKTYFCRPKPPCIKYKRVCPKPVACPCDLEHFGYYPTCWQAWPFPQDYSHCPTPPMPPLMLPPPAPSSVAPPAALPKGEPLPPPTHSPKVTLRLPEMP